MARVLIADDCATTAAILSAEIEAEGHDVTLAMTGLDAYEQVLALRPGAVFLAPALDVYDGYETCSLLRADPDVPERLPIYLLGGAELDRRRLERAGATGSFPHEHQAADLRELLSQLPGAR